MATSLLTTTSEVTYKGHTISVMETPLQVFFVINHNLKSAHMSMADAKRCINGQPCLYESVDITWWA